MTDIIERAEALRARQSLPEVFRPTWDELLVELKSVRAKNIRLSAENSRLKFIYEGIVE